MADFQALVRQLSGYETWSYGQSLPWDKAQSVLNGYAQVEVAGLVNVTGTFGGPQVTNPSLILTNTGTGRFTGNQLNLYDFSLIDGVGLPVVYFHGGGTIRNVNDTACVISFRPGCGPLTLESSTIKYFSGFLEGCTLTDVTCVGQTTGAWWRGSDNTFTRVIDTGEGGSKTSVLVAFPIPTAAKPSKSFTGNRFIDCEAKAIEELIGFDGLPGSGHGPSWLIVDSVNGNQVSATVGRDDYWNVTSQDSVGLHMIVLNGAAAGRYFPITAYSNNTWTVGPSRFCSSLTGLQAGDRIGIVALWADNDYEGCTAWVRNELPQGAGTDNGYEYPNTGFSFFGLCFGNVVKYCSVKRDPAETIPTADLYSPAHTFTKGISETAMHKLMYDGDEPTYVDMVVNGWNHYLFNDLSGADMAFAGNTQYNRMWLDPTESYDDVDHPIITDYENIGEVYSHDIFFIGNHYPSEPSEIFTVLALPFYPTVTPDPLPRTVATDIKNIRWAGNSDALETDYIWDQNYRWFGYDASWAPMTVPLNAPSYSTSTTDGISELGVFFDFILDASVAAPAEPASGVGDTYTSGTGTATQVAPAQGMGLVLSSGLGSASAVSMRLFDFILDAGTLTKTVPLSRLLVNVPTPPDRPPFRAEQGSNRRGTIYAGTRRTVEYIGQDHRTVHDL